MRTKRSIGYLVETDGRVVWVNSSMGMCIGRFSKDGVDVHADYDGQRAGIHCLDCIHDLPPVEAWDRFVASMKKFHDVDVDASFRPAFVIAATGCVT